MLRGTRSISPRTTILNTCHVAWHAFHLSAHHNTQYVVVRVSICVPYTVSWMPVRFVCKTRIMPYPAHLCAVSASDCALYVLLTVRCTCPDRALCVPITCPLAHICYGTDRKCTIPVLAAKNISRKCVDNIVSRLCTVYRFIYIYIYIYKHTYQYICVPTRYVVIICLIIRIVYEILSTFSCNSERNFYVNNIYICKCWIIGETLHYIFTAIGKVKLFHWSYIRNCNIYSIQINKWK